MEDNVKVESDEMDNFVSVASEIMAAFCCLKGCPSSG